MRLFLNMHNGRERIEDPEGAEFESIAEARDEAIDAARALMSEQVLAGVRPGQGRFEITDASGTVLLVLLFSEALSDN